MNGLTLAYMGDAYYEVEIRRYLIEVCKLTHVDQLHKKAITYTSGTAQAKIVTHFIDENILLEHEVDYVKRGRNASGPGRKNIDAKTYHMATGFEALIGHLYLTDQTRVKKLIREAIEYIERG